jgi:hypothetical protein
MQRKYCSVNDVINLTGLSRTTVNKLITLQKIQTTKVLDRRLCLISSIQHLLSEDNDNEI